MEITAEHFETLKSHAGTSNEDHGRQEFTGENAIGKFLEFMAANIAGFNQLQ